MGSTFASLKVGDPVDVETSFPGRKRPQVDRMFVVRVAKRVLFVASKPDFRPGAVHSWIFRRRDGSHAAKRSTCDSTMRLVPNREGGSDAD